MAEALFISQSDPAAILIDRNTADFTHAFVDFFAAYSICVFYARSVARVRGNGHISSGIRDYYIAAMTLVCSFIHDGLQLVVLPALFYMHTPCQLANK